jgi:hypothetical protein
MTNLFIAKNTIVQDDRSNIVTLSGDVYVEAFRRDPDGCYVYQVGPRTFKASAGTVRVL